MTSKIEQDGIQHISFNQNGSCFAVGTHTGIHIFNVDPFMRRYSCMQFGVTIVEMLDCTSLLALIGTRKNGSDFSPRHLRLWDTSTGTVIREMSFGSAVLAIRLNRIRLVVCCSSKLYIFALDSDDCPLLDTLETLPSVGCTHVGLSSVLRVKVKTEDSVSCFVAYPSTILGHVSLYDTARLRMINIFPVFSTGLSALAVNKYATMLSVVSEDGTTVKVFHLPSAVCMATFQRGLLKKNVFRLAFAVFPSESKLIGLPSGAGTVHIFRITEPYEKESTRNIGNGKNSDLSILETKPLPTKPSLLPWEEKEMPKTQPLPTRSNVLPWDDKEKEVPKTTIDALPWDDNETFEIVDGNLSAGPAGYHVVQWGVGGSSRSDMAQSLQDVVALPRTWIAKFSQLSRSSASKAIASIKPIMNESGASVLKTGMQVFPTTFRDLHKPASRAFAIARLRQGTLCGASRRNFQFLRQKVSQSKHLSSTIHRKQSLHNAVSTTLKITRDMVGNSSSLASQTEEERVLESARNRRRIQKCMQCAIAIREEIDSGCARLITVTYDGYILKYEIDLNTGGKCSLVNESPLFAPDIDLI